MAHLSTHADGDLVKRVRRIAGQVQAIERSILAASPCADVLHQAAAVRGAVNGLMDEIVAEHLANHVAAPDLSDAERAAGAAELLAVIRRYVK